MDILLAFGYLLAVFPLLVAMLFSSKVASRRQKTLQQDLEELDALQVPGVRAWGGPEGISKAIEEYYSRSRSFWPTLILSALYWLGFQLSHSYVATVLNLGNTSPFPLELAKASGPVCMTFLGVYAFNMGTTVRRLYLDDLSETMFWGGLNRLVLSESLAIVFEAGTGSELKVTGFIVYFAIGFLANPFLARVLEVASKAAKLGTASGSTDDLSLRSVQGINIWKEYRLEEEGIESAENLSTADVIGLAIKTHYSLRTLIDWIDQAALIVRLRKKAAKLLEAGIAVSAIEFAWRAPLNGGDSRANALIAKTLEMDPVLLEDTMNALYQDQDIQNIWKLWQALGTGGLERYSPAAGPSPGSGGSASQVDSTDAPPRPAALGPSEH
jgi:hypothetical protein